MQLQSSVFANQGIIPAKYTCDGDNTSPPLSWDTPPVNTSSFVLIVEDPDAPKGTFTHWIVYDIPANQHQLLEGIANESTLPDGSKQGKNDFGELGFGGFTPLEGLMMDKRCGDIDPEIVGYLARKEGVEVKEVEEWLNKKSGWRC